MPTPSRDEVTMTEPKDDNVPVEEVLTPATPGAEALPSTEDDEDEAPAE